MSCENIDQHTPSQRLIDQNTLSHQKLYTPGAQSSTQHRNPHSGLGGKIGSHINSKGSSNKTLKLTTGRQVVQCVCTHAALPPEDHTTAFGRYVAAEIRNIGDRQVERDTKRLIMNLLFEAQSKVEKQKEKNNPNSMVPNQVGNDSIGSNN